MVTEPSQRSIVPMILINPKRWVMKVIEKKAKSSLFSLDRIAHTG
jgi:hypothetical protein